MILYVWQTKEYRYWWGWITRRTPVTPQRQLPRPAARVRA
jgi:hypothetical protein